MATPRSSPDPTTRTPLRGGGRGVKDLPAAGVMGGLRQYARSEGVVSSGTGASEERLHGEDHAGAQAKLEEVGQRNGDPVAPPDPLPAKKKNVGAQAKAAKFTTEMMSTEKNLHAAAADGQEGKTLKRGMAEVPTEKNLNAAGAADGQDEKPLQGKVEKVDVRDQCPGDAIINVQQNDVPELCPEKTIATDMSKEAVPDHGRRNEGRLQSAGSEGEVSSGTGATEERLQSAKEGVDSRRNGATEEQLLPAQSVGVVPFGDGATEELQHAARSEGVTSLEDGAQEKEKRKEKAFGGNGTTEEQSQQARSVSVVSFGSGAAEEPLSPARSVGVDSRENAPTERRWSK